MPYWSNAHNFPLCSIKRMTLGSHSVQLWWLRKRYLRHMGGKYRMKTKEHSRNCRECFQRTTCWVILQKQGWSQISLLSLVFISQPGEERLPGSVWWFPSATAVGEWACSTWTAAKARRLFLSVHEEPPLHLLGERLPPEEVHETSLQPRCLGTFFKKRPIGSYGNLIYISYLHLRCLHITPQQTTKKPIQIKDTHAAHVGLCNVYLLSLDDLSTHWNSMSVKSEYGRVTSEPSRAGIMSRCTGSIRLKGPLKILFFTCIQLSPQPTADTAFYMSEEPGSVSLTWDINNSPVHVWVPVWLCTSVCVCVCVCLKVYGYV